MLIFEKLLIFLILMMVGLLLAKLRIIDEKTGKKLAAIVLYAANPALIIISSQAAHDIPDADLLITLLIAAVMYTILIALAAVLPKMMKLNRDEAGAYALMTVFSNVGYMGIPLVSELLGSAAVLYVAVFVLMFSVLIYTYGVIVLQRINPGAGNRFSPRKLINPGVVSSILAVTFYVLRIQLPEVLTAPLKYLGDLTAPLSMMIIGATLANAKFRSFFADLKLLGFSVMKLLVLPIVFGLTLKAIIGGGEQFSVCVIMMSAPVGSMTVMIAQQYGGDYTLLSRGVTLTTVLCIATIPLIFAVLI